MNTVKRLAISADGDTTFADGDDDHGLPLVGWPLTQKAIGKQFADALQYRDGLWIWVYHAPPNNSPISWSGQPALGDAALNGWIADYSPDLVICGHVHEAPFSRQGSWVDRIGPDLGVQHRPADRGGADLDRHRHRGARSSVVFATKARKASSSTRRWMRPISPLREMPAWMASCHRAASP